MSASRMAWATGIQVAALEPEVTYLFSVEYERLLGPQEHARCRHARPHRSTSAPHSSPPAPKTPLDEAVAIAIATLDRNYPNACRPDWSGTGRAGRRDPR